MKRFVSIIMAAFILMLVFIGCATTTPEQRKETYDLRKDVGNQPFVGSSQNLDARGLMPMLTY